VGGGWGELAVDNSLRKGASTREFGSRNYIKTLKMFTVDEVREKDTSCHLTVVGWKKGKGRLKRGGKKAFNLSPASHTPVPASTRFDKQKKNSERRRREERKTIVRALASSQRLML
jgi:hypothetical protein